MKLKLILSKDPQLKKIALWMLQAPMRPRPRWWIRIFVNPFVHRRGKHALIRRRTRLDVFPMHAFELGAWSTIEDFSCINNAMGPVFIGNHSRIGLSNTIIGPVHIGSNVNIAQHVVISGLNHGYENIHLAPRLQPCSLQPVHISDDCWIGANVVITAGVHIGQHCVIAAGSVVTKSVEAYSLVAGNPARVIKKYDFESQSWQKVEALNLQTKSYGKAV